MAKIFEIDRMSEFGTLHTAENHPMACVTKFYKGVCGYCEPEKWKKLIEEGKKEDKV